jgi:hypothetical protein
MEGSVVVVLNIWEIIVPCVGVLGIVHMQDSHDHPIDNLGEITKRLLGYARGNIQWSCERRVS